jgi:hypothetical protein
VSPSSRQVLPGRSVKAEDEVGAVYPGGVWKPATSSPASTFWTMANAALAVRV